MVSSTKQSPGIWESHGQLRQFIQMEQSGFNSEINQKGWISGELNRLKNINTNEWKYNNSNKRFNPLMFSTLYKDLRLVVSIQTNYTWIQQLHSTERSFFYPIKVFFLIEPRGFFICGGKWRKSLSLYYTIQTLDTPGIRPDAKKKEQRPDYWVRPRQMLTWQIATSSP